MMLNPSELDHFLFQIREASKSSDIKANPFLFLVKPTEENLAKYRIRRPQSALLFLLEIVLHFPFIVLHLLHAILFSFYRYQDWTQSRKQHNLPFTNLFISHFTHAQVPGQNDLFFGSENHTSDSFTFFLNHTRIKRKNIFRDYELHGQNNVEINAKTLSPLLTLKLQIRQFRTSAWLFRSSLLRKELSTNERRLLLKSSRAQHSRGTIANLVFEICLKELIERIQPKNIVFTIEGHSHELLILGLRKNFFDDIRLIAYQHAPVVPSQFNIFRIASCLRPQDVLLTSGQISKKLALKQDLSCRIDILGSTKHRECSFTKKNWSHVRILFAPEGTEESLEYFGSLIQLVASLSPNIKCILRVHPALEIRALRMPKSLFEHSENFMMSSLSLCDELKLCNFVVYRSSAVAIEGLAYGAVPIHISPLGDESLNPLAFSENLVFTARTSQDIGRIIEEFDIDILGTSYVVKSTYEIHSLYFAKMRKINDLIH